jgi:hypothetical protein
VSIVWTYIKNEDAEQYFCVHCNNLIEMPFFHSDFEVEGQAHGELAKIGDGHIVCLRCARVLMRLMFRLGEHERKP